MSVLDRFKDTSKYDRVMRELGMLIVLNRAQRQEPGLFLKKKDADRCGWDGDPSDFPEADERVETFGSDGTEEEGIFFKSPRLVILRGAYKDDITFVENSKERNMIEGLYHEVNHLYDRWKENHPGQPSPYRRRRLVLCYLVDKNGVPVHKKPLYISMHGGASKVFCQRYAQFLEQLEGAYAKATNDKSAQGFGERMCASVIWTPTFGAEQYGETQKSPIAVPQSWLIPTEKNILSFWPKKDADIDHFEDVWESCPIQVYAAKFFKQCEAEIGINALKPGVDLANCTLPPADSSLGAKDETGALSGGLT